MLQIFVQGQALHTLEVAPETTVAALKGVLAAAEGVSACDQVVTYAGVPLEDEVLLLEAVPEQGTLCLSARVVGGQCELLLCLRVVCLLCLH